MEDHIEDLIDSLKDGIISIGNRADNITAEGDYFSKHQASSIKFNAQDSLKKLGALEAILKETNNKIKPLKK